MHRAGPAAAMIALLVGVACGTAVGVTAADLRTHAEATLTYPSSYGVRHSQVDESPGGGFENTSPSPAMAEIQFYTADGVDLVIGWYDAWLTRHGWFDAQSQGNGHRDWVRGQHEDYLVSCGFQSNSPDHWCDVQYYIRSARFPAPNAAAPPFGDPVSQAAVEERQVGQGAAGTDYSHPGIARDGTAEASAARANWPSQVCCGRPILLLDKSAAEQASPLRSAYHVSTIQVAEYDRPDVQGEGYGFIERSEKYDLANSGFVLRKSGRTNLRGLPADAFEYTRGDREAVLFAITYGPNLNEPGTLNFRIATLSIIYDVAPKACLVTGAGCFDVLFGAQDAAWSPTSP